jgi:hypothetical protein
MPLIEREEGLAGCIAHHAPPLWRLDRGNRRRVTSVVARHRRTKPPSAPLSGRRSWRGGKLLPLACMAGRKDEISSTDSPHKVVGDHGVIDGARSPPHQLQLRPPKLKKTPGEPYLAAPPAGEKRRPTPTYWHHATPRHLAGKSPKTTT